MLTSEWPDKENPHSAPFIKRQVEYLRYHNIDIDLYHFKGLGNPFNYIRSWVEVRRKLNLEKYDIVHAQWGQSAILAIGSSLPLVITYRGSDVNGIYNAKGLIRIKSFFLKIVSKRLSLKASGVITVSKSLKNLLPKGLNVNIIPSGIDLKIFRPESKESARKKLGLSLTSKYVLFPSNIKMSAKRYHLAKEVINIVRDHIKVSLITLHKQNPENVALFMNACDVMLLTSANEGSPNVIKEAMACNMPIVSTAVGDVQERIGRIPGCFVCSNDSPHFIAKHLVKALENPNRVNSRKDIMHLDENIVTKNVISVYECVLSKKL